MGEPVFTFTKPPSAEKSSRDQENIEEKSKLKQYENSDDNWEKVASAASEKLVKELQEKKVMYDEMNDKKRQVEELIGVKETQVKEKRKKLDQYSSKIADKSSLILAKEMAVAMIKAQIKNEMESRRCLEDDEMKEKDLIENLFSELKTLENDLDELRRGISDISAIDDIVGKNSDLKTSMEDLRDLNKNIVSDVDMLKKTADEYEDFLEKSIAAKVVSLECPVCLTTAKPPIFSCHKMHHICEGCFDKLDEASGAYGSARCPVCRLRYYRYKGEIRHRPAEETWKEVMVLQEKLKGLHQNKAFKKEQEEKEEEEEERYLFDEKKEKPNVSYVPIPYSLSVGSIKTLAGGLD